MGLLICYKWFYHLSFTWEQTLCVIFFHFRIKTTTSQFLSIICKNTFSCFTLFLHGKFTWQDHIAADNDAGEWLGYDSNKEYKDSFKEEQRKRKGIPILGPALCQGQTDVVFATAAIVPSGAKKRLKSHFRY